MFVGSSLEDGLMKVLRERLSYLGYHVRGGQIPVGGSNPAWDGYLDGLIDVRVGETWTKPFVLEIKTKSGYGADLFYDTPQPDDSYMIQLGLYLKDLHEKGVTNEGCFLYLLLSDKHFGTMVCVSCHYDASTEEIISTEYVNSDGTSGTLKGRTSIKSALERWTALDAYIEKKETPAGEYKYKEPLTREALASLSDSKLLKIMEGSLVYGHWRPKYSRYKNKQLEVDGVVPEVTSDEQGAARVEYHRRHPRSKK